MNNLYTLLVCFFFTSCNSQTTTQRYSTKQLPKADMKQQRLDYINSRFFDLQKMQREFRLWEEGIQPEIESIFNNYSTDSNKVNGWLRHHKGFDKEQEDSLVSLMNGLKKLDTNLSPQFYEQWNKWLDSREKWLQYDRETFVYIKKFVVDVCKHNNDISRDKEIAFYSETTRQHFVKELTEMGTEMDKVTLLTDINKQLAMSSLMAAMTQLIQDNQ